MDIAYAVKQLDREIAIASAQLAEKKVTREKLFSALNPQEQALLASQNEADSKAAAKTDTGKK